MVGLTLYQVLWSTGYINITMTVQGSSKNKPAWQFVFLLLVPARAIYLFRRTCLVLTLRYCTLFSACFQWLLVSQTMPVSYRTTPWIAVVYPLVIGWYIILQILTEVWHSCGGSGHVVGVEGTPFVCCFIIPGKQEICPECIFGTWHQRETGMK
jgi:hypothetical protein